jgi:predicted amidohydrolase
VRNLKRVLLLLTIGAATCAAQSAQAGQTGAGGQPKTLRVCAAESTPRWIDWHLKPAEALTEVDRTLGGLERLVHRAGTAGCDALALPEDSLGVLHWEVGNKALMQEVLPQAVGWMLDRLGRAAAAHHMYLVCSSDVAGQDGTYRNAAFFLGRDGKEIGRYYKVDPTVTESDRIRGSGFPVFETPDLGGVGMLICYDMVMPEASRSLALGGAGLIFVSTMGGAATAGDEDMNRAAFRTRAVDNFVYLVVAMRGGAAMIVSPQGRVLAETSESGGFAMADINPFGGREGGDALNFQQDMRARLFRERNPAAYGILTDPNPPVLKKIPATITVEEAVRIGSGALTIGEDRFQEAEELLRAGKTTQAALAFEKLRAEFPHTWIDREAQKRLAKIRAGAEPVR